MNCVQGLLPLRWSKLSNKRQARLQAHALLLPLCGLDPNHFADRWKVLSRYAVQDAMLQPEAQQGLVGTAALQKDAMPLQVRSFVRAAWLRASNLNLANSPKREGKVETNQSSPGADLRRDAHESFNCVWVCIGLGNLEHRSGHHFVSRFLHGHVGHGKSPHSILTFRHCAQKLYPMILVPLPRLSGAY